MKNKKDVLAGKPEGLVALIRFSIYMKKRKKLTPHHPLIR